uniref:Uncharacterized protein n=1 Tax=Pristionchus pacificus TaxID=54126 RepID=A0A2A6BSK3_PRIPA|eukprot:PDM68806.1 hypothetical protein PRIPAC_47108 [Pristionchus pacificus]
MVVLNNINIVRKDFMYLPIFRFIIMHCTEGVAELELQEMSTPKWGSAKAAVPAMRSSLTNANK